MKVFRLSSASERVTGVCISGLMLAGIVLLLLALRGAWLSFLLCAAVGLLLLAGIGIYIWNLLCAACIPQGEGKLLVRGLPRYTMDLSGAVGLETAACKNGPMTTRSLRFTDENGEVVGTLQTFFTARQGAKAEPLARELAQALGLRFRPQLEPWEYDSAARKAHQRELDEQEKAARKERTRRLKEKIFRTAGKGKPAPAHSEEDLAQTAQASDDAYGAAEDGINYDAMDDLR